MGTWISQIISSMGYAGVVLLALLENVFPPIPSEVIMPMAGFSASQGAMTLGGAIVAGTLGSVVGALVLYALGWWFGEQRLMDFADRHGRWLTLSREDIQKASAWFDSHGILAVLTCRLIPGMRSLISIPAGLQHMNLMKFLVATTTGSLMWTTLLVYAGYALGANFAQVEIYIGPVSNIVVAGIAIIYIWRVLHHKGSAKRS